MLWASQCQSDDGGGPCESGGYFWLLTWFLSFLKDHITWRPSKPSCSGVCHRMYVLVYATGHFSECLLWTSPVRELTSTQTLSLTSFIKETEALQPQTLSLLWSPLPLSIFTVTEYTLRAQLIKSMTLS